MKPESTPGPSLLEASSIDRRRHGKHRVRRLIGDLGFTLVELMVVIGLIALVMAMGMPSILQTLKKEPLRQGVSDLVEGLSAARAQAILDGVPAEFVLRSLDKSMWVARARHPDAANEVSSAAGDGPVSSSTPGVRPFFAQLQPDVFPSLVEVNLRSQMDTEEARVRFYPNGTSDEFTILLESRAGARKVSLDSITALADVEVVR
jgi:prepilin-type N-terminal cleavage/methylation domain-containing protein